MCRQNPLNEITRTRIATTNTDFEYDGVPGASNGNLVNDGVRTYEWDALNRLVKVYKTPSSPVQIGEYTYDALGRRIRKVVTNGGLSGTISNGTTDYLYNTQWQCVEERNGSNAMTRQYVWGLYIDELIYLNLQNAQGPSMSNGHKFPVQDLLYRTAAVFPDDDTVPDEVYDYDAYGNTLIFNAPGTASNWWANNATQTKVPNCEALFTGQHYDSESEIYLYRHRMYAPGLGRFVSRDRIPTLPQIRLRSSSPLIHGMVHHHEVITQEVAGEEDSCLLSPEGVVSCVSPPRPSNSQRLYEYCVSRPETFVDPAGENPAIGALGGFHIWGALSLICLRTYPESPLSRKTVFEFGLCL